MSEGNRQKLYKQWSSFLDSSKTTFIEKSPPNLLKTRFLQALFPNAYFIVIRRNPIATSLATKKWSNSSIFSLLRHWLFCYDLWESDKCHIANYLELRYEDFVDSPTLIMEKICNFCMIDDPNPILQKMKEISISTQINQKYFDSWKTKKIQQVLVKLFFNNKIKQHNYSVDDALS